MNTEFPTRAVKPSYNGQNGFAKDFTEPEDITPQNLQNALDDAHRGFMFMLNHQKRDVPDFETMKADVETPDDPTTLRLKLETLRENHLGDLNSFYSLSTEEYKQEVMDAYLSKDDSWLADENDKPSSPETRLIELYDDAFGDVKFDPTDASKRYNPLQTQWHNQFETIRHAHLSRLIPLEKQKREAEAYQEQRQKMLERMFPQSKIDFASKAADVRMRVARFLVADHAKQEKFIESFGWAWRQVQPLLDIFKQDQEFNAEIRGMVLSEQAVQDPRKVRLAA